MSETPLVAPRVSIWHHACSVIVIGLFVAAASQRLNDCDLFNPDSPRYLIYAQGMLNLGEYRAIDLPGQPVYSWRPPGLSLLLTPALLFRPYDVIAAKVMVLAAGAFLLLAVHGLVILHGGRWAGPLAVALTASSPVMLVLSTEVLSEVPYALAVLAVLYWLGRFTERPQVPNTLRFVAIFIALLWLPAIRTVGVSLVVAVALWSLVSRWRFPYLLVAALAGGSIYWRMKHGQAAGGDNYAASLFDGLRERGFDAVVAEAWQTMQFYWAALPGILFPGLLNERPFYAMLSLDPLPSTEGLSRLLNIASIIVLLAGLWGVWTQRRKTGSLVMFYLPLYLGCLAVWPWRHERFLWPLIPLLWTFVPAGVSSVMQTFQPGTRRWLMPLVILIGLALCQRHLWSDASLIATNARAVADRDGFHTRERPGFYFSDWRRAGTWLQANTPPHARLLTWHAAVGGTAHRFQKRVAFETLSPERLRQQITAFSARHLVVSDAHWGDGFGWRQLSADPACVLKVVYRDRDVAVLQAEPNRTGEVSRTAYDDWLNEQLASIDDFLAQHPGRHDVIVRRASLLRELGRNDEAITDLQGLVEKGHSTVRVCSDLGWALFEERRYADAAKYLELARTLPNAESVSAVLADGAERARSRLAESPAEVEAKSEDRLVSRIASHVAALKWTRAEQDTDALLALAPDRAEPHYWRGYLYHIFGELARAEWHYEVAQTLGHEEARAKLELLRLTTAFANERMEDGLTPDSPIAESSDSNAANLTTVDLDPNGLDAPASALNPENAREVITAKIIIDESAVPDAAGTGVAPTDPSLMPTHVRFAKLLDEYGWPGRSITVLEAARARFGDKTELLVPLAELYRRFAHPELAAPLYRLAEQAWPHDKSIRQGLNACEAVLREPAF